MGGVQEYSLHFFSGGAAYVCDWDRGGEGCPTVPTKSLRLFRLAIPSFTDFID